MNNCVITTTIPELKMRKVVHEYNTTIIVNENKYMITVPKDFIYDGASIPAPFWIIFGTPYGVYNDTPGCVHDYLYDEISNNSIEFDNKKITISRAEADWIFYLLLCKNGVWKLKAYIMYLTVYTFGFLFYKNGYKKYLSWSHKISDYLYGIANCIE